MLFLYLLVWASLYLFSIFWCIYFSSETKTDNEVSFIPNLEENFVQFDLKCVLVLYDYLTWTIDTAPNWISPPFFAPPLREVLLRRPNWPLWIEWDLHNCTLSIVLTWQIWEIKYESSISRQRCQRWCKNRPAGSMTFPLIRDPYKWLTAEYGCFRRRF